MDGINGIDRIVFRPPIILRAMLGFFGMLCCAVALNGWISGRYLYAPSMVVLTGLLLLPSLVGAAVVGRRVEITKDGIRSFSLTGSRFMPWTAVKRIDQGRSSFVIETSAGPVSA